MVAFDLLFISYDNAGGHIAHLGGAAAGWFFAAGLAKGIDRTQWINDLLDLLSGKLKVNWSKWFNWNNWFDWSKLRRWKEQRNFKMKFRPGGKQTGGSTAGGTRNNGKWTAGSHDGSSQGRGRQQGGSRQQSGAYYSDREKDYEFNAQKNAQKKERQEELNHILDKLRKSGYGSLSDEEKRRLFDQNS